MSGQRPVNVAEIAAAIAKGQMAPSEAVGDAIGRLTSGDVEYKVVAHGLYETALLRRGQPTTRWRTVRRWPRYMASRSV